MTDTTLRKLPPMSALEFAISNVFRHFFFGLRMAILWAILLSPLMLLVWYAAFRDGPPDFKALKPEAMAALAALGVGVILATISVAVNWHRRIVLGETPRRFGWVRLDGVVWRYLFGFIFVLAVLAIMAGAAAAAVLMLPGVLEPKVGAAAKPIGIALAVLLGLSALFTWYRLSTWLPAIATRDQDYSLKTAWRITRKNRTAFLSFTFWLLFSLAIAGAIGAGAFFGQQMLANPYATAAFFGLAGLLGWMALFLVTTVATSHYCYFADRETFPKTDG